MSIRKFATVGLFVLIAGFAANAAHGVEVLKNGSFEQNTLGTPDFVDIWNMHNGTTLDHWTRQTDHGKYLMKAGNGLSLGSASDGEYFLNVIGRDTMIAGSPQFDMTQTFNVVIGETYTVSYDLASRPGSTTSATIEISAGGESLSHTVASLGAGTDNPATYQQFQFQFVASANTATLRILGPTLNGVAGFYLDNLSVDGMAVPEPASLALLGAGALMVLRRRRIA